ncbi:HvfX family Cu-binding RiPP maturation protein [Lysobacter antibioticus]|uniref:HvfX family Cu-binding RiPP maturation protein n=1 Tax=Lysobacter antibioticus TaxID=84531 RepID=UPI000345F62C|nr:DoxX family protein [Lysobacter antibioticus]
MSTVATRTDSSARVPFLVRIDAVGRWLAPLGLRALLAWEFFEAGREKLHGQNWFAELGGRFPPPFSWFGADLNWHLATGLELGASVALLLGLGTRYAAAALWVLTLVAIGAVHWPQHWANLAELWRGYAITDDGYGNYKLPLLYLAMLLPLILNGAGRLSLDALIARRTPVTASADRRAWGWTALAIGLSFAPLLPVFGAALAVLGLGLLTLSRLQPPRPLAAASP